VLLAVLVDEAQRGVERAGQVPVASDPSFNPQDQPGINSVDGLKVRR
jgi:hypothetical protein